MIKNLSFVTLDIMVETMWMHSVFKAIKAQGVCFLTNINGFHDSEN